MEEAAAGLPGEEVGRDAAGNRRRFRRAQGDRRAAAGPRRRRMRAAGRRAAGWGRVGAWGGLVPLVVTGWMMWSQPEPGPDPHLERARVMVAAHELGRPPEALDYRDPVYRAALDELARVGPESVSAAEARRLEAQLAQAIRGFRERLQARQTAVGSRQVAERAREETVELEQRLDSGVDRTAVFTEPCAED